MKINLKTDVIRLNCGRLITSYFEIRVVTRKNCSQLETKNPKMDLWRADVKIKFVQRRKQEVFKRLL